MKLRADMSTSLVSRSKRTLLQMQRLRLFSQAMRTIMTTEPQSVLVSFPHLPYSSSGVVCLVVCVLLA